MQNSVSGSIICCKNHEGGEEGTEVKVGSTRQYRGFRNTAGVVTVGGAMPRLFGFWWVSKDAALVLSQCLFQCST
jgi:hypothetical protein